MDARATSQIWPDLPNCRVKGWAGHLGRPVGGRYLIGALMPGCQIHQTVALNLDPFRPPCRAGGVDNVGKVAGVRSAECGVRSAEWGVGSAEWRVRSGECRVGNLHCVTFTP